MNEVNPKKICIWRDFHLNSHRRQNYKDSQRNTVIYLILGICKFYVFSCQGVDIWLVFLFWFLKTIFFWTFTVPFLDSDDFNLHEIVVPLSMLSYFALAAPKSLVSFTVFTFFSLSDSVSIFYFKVFKALRNYINVFCQILELSAKYYFNVWSLSLSSLPFLPLPFVCECGTCLFVDVPVCGMAMEAWSLYLVYFLISIHIIEAGSLY